MLRSRFSLECVDENEVETIMFGSTCRYVVLSGGTFSYIIGLFAFFSKVFYPKMIELWFPVELYSLDNWTEIPVT